MMVSSAELQLLLQSQDEVEPEGESKPNNGFIKEKANDNDP